MTPMRPRQSLQPQPTMMGGSAPAPLQFAPPPQAQEGGGGNMEQAFSGLGNLMSALQNRPVINPAQQTDGPVRRPGGFNPQQAGQLDRMANA